MIRSSRRTAVLAGLGISGAAGVLGLALAVPSIAQAVDPTPGPSSSESAAPGQPGQPGQPDKADKQARQDQRQKELAAALAKELGIDQAKVAAALEKVQTARQAEAKAERLTNLKTRLDQAVTAGKLTRAEADAILKAAENGVLPHGAGGRHGGGFPGGGRPGR
ncbi:MAG TPA: hypothetical protein VF755_20425 [Catenuloplanes sp.]